MNTSIKKNMTRVHLSLLLLALFSGFSEVIHARATRNPGKARKYRSAASKFRGTVFNFTGAFYRPHLASPTIQQAAVPDTQAAVSNRQAADREDQTAVPSIPATVPSTEAAVNKTRAALPNTQAVIPNTTVVGGTSTSNSQCTPMVENFTSSSLPPSWVQVSTNPLASKMNPGGGVNLTLNPPAGAITVSADGKTNDKLGDGSTLNSTFSLLYGKVTMSFVASDVRGAVSALVLFGTTTRDEIDIEMVGGDTTHWQSNVFRPAPGETAPLYGVFGGVHAYPNSGTTVGTHTYTIDWSPTGITWIVDGNVVRTLTPQQTLHNGQLHYPSARSRIQIGLWDGSSPVSTSEWANGPLPWTQRQRKAVTATIKSVKVECPY